MTLIRVLQSAGMTPISTRLTVPSAIMSAQSDRSAVTSHLPSAAETVVKRGCSVTDDKFQGPLIFAVDRAIAVIVGKPLVRADDVSPWCPSRTDRPSRWV